ncbi:hypothetical protein OAK51_05105 [Alphaproteobacteria bacterium]|nr:hypothetical protein [Alphaproteobacteria bacterium]
MRKNSYEKIDNQKDYENRKVRENIKSIINKNKQFNLRVLSRILKKNDAYLQQYLYRGTPKFLPEEFRYKLSQVLKTDINELTPQWLQKVSHEGEVITFQNIEKKNTTTTNVITLSKQLLTDIDFSKKEKLFFFQTIIKNFKITTIIDISINEYLKPDLYLLNDKSTLFLAHVEMIDIAVNKVSVKPYLNTFSPFQINLQLLKISARVLWQSSKIF